MTDNTCATCGCNLHIGFQYRKKGYCRKHYEVKKGIRDARGMLKSITKEKL